MRNPIRKSPKCGGLWLAIVCVVCAVALSGCGQGSDGVARAQDAARDLGKQSASTTAVSDYDSERYLETEKRLQRQQNRLRDGIRSAAGASPAAQ